MALPEEISGLLTEFDADITTLVRARDNIRALLRLGDDIGSDTVTLRTLVAVKNRANTAAAHIVTLTTPE